MILTSLLHLAPPRTPARTLAAAEAATAASRAAAEVAIAAARKADQQLADAYAEGYRAGQLNGLRTAVEASASAFRATHDAPAADLVLAFVGDLNRRVAALQIEAASQESDVGAATARRDDAAADGSLASP